MDLVLQSVKTDSDSRDDIFITRNTFRQINDSIDTEGAVDDADSLLDDFDVVEENNLLDFSNQKDNSSVVPSQDEHDEFSDFPEVSVFN